jgi:hypothetical protein
VCWKFFVPVWENLFAARKWPIVDAAWLGLVYYLANPFFRSYVSIPRFFDFGPAAVVGFLFALTGWPRKWFFGTL